MRKYLIRFWRGYIAFKDAAKDSESEYVTIRITLNSDLETLSQTGNLLDGGEQYSLNATDMRLLNPNHQRTTIV